MLPLPGYRTLIYQLGLLPQVRRGRESDGVGNGGTEWDQA